jgi:hypothetical protein
MSTDNIVISSRNVDYSKLVGREIRIRTEQFPGRLLSTRVLAVTDNNLVIDRSGSSGRIDQLINNQNVEVCFDYKGEPVVFTSILAIPKPGGRFQIPVGADVKPQVRRRFVRFDTIRNVRLTFFDDTNIGYVRLSRLKWVETDTINLSGGGMLVWMPLSLCRDDYMIMNLGIEEIPVPQLLVGKIRHRQRHDDRQDKVGVEFITRENCNDKLPQNLIRNLPFKLFDFDDRTSSELSDFLSENNQNTMEQ